MRNPAVEEPWPARRVIPNTGVNRLSRRFLEVTQDVIVLALVLVLFALMARTLWRLVRDVAEPELDFRFVVSEVLFMFVMFELVRGLVVYLREHHVGVDFMVEVGIVSALREVVLHGVVELEWEQVVALAVFVLALGFLLRFGDLRVRGLGAAGDPRPMEDANEHEPAVPAARGASGAG